MSILQNPKIRIAAIAVGVILISVALYLAYNYLGSGTETATDLNQPIEITGETTQTEGGWLNKAMIVLGIIFLAAFVGVLIYAFFIYIPFNLYLRARMSNVQITPMDMAKMKFQKVAVTEVVELLIKAHEAGLIIAHHDLVSVYLAGGKMDKIIYALISAHNANLKLSLAELVNQYLAKVDIDLVVMLLTKAKNAGLDLSLNSLSQYYLAKINISELVDVAIRAKEAKLGVGIDTLVSHAQGGGNILRVVNAVIAANNADNELEMSDKLNLNWGVAANIDLSGINVGDAVNDAINFKVIETTGVTAVALDGVQLTMKVKVTIRPKIRKIIRGAGEETIVARINENIVSVIGSTDTHYEILRNPFIIADKVEEKKFLFEDTAYDVKSIDLSNIVVGKDIHAELEVERSRAAAERAKAEVIKAEEEVQKAMADAFREGNFSIEDYLKMKNMKADTGMRESLIPRQRSND